MRDKKGRFLPGTSGNQYGRPPKKEAVFTDALRRMVNPVALAEKLLEMAMGGDLAAIRYVYDRLDGKPKETIRQVINQIPSYVGFISSDDYLINKSITNEKEVQDDENTEN